MTKKQINKKSKKQKLMSKFQLSTQLGVNFIIKFKFQVRAKLGQAWRLRIYVVCIHILRIRVSSLSFCHLNYFRDNNLKSCTVVIFIFYAVVIFILHCATPRAAQTQPKQTKMLLTLGLRVV